MFTKHLYQALILCLLMVGSSLNAQCFRSFSDDVRSLQIRRPGGDIHTVPVLSLTDQRALFVFDHLSHEYCRFRYHIVHCNADWTPSDLLETEYVNGFAEGIIDNYANSVNTTVLYTHYEFSIPNEETRGLKCSGNYRIDILSDESEAPVACFYLMLAEPLVSSSGSVLTSTDIDTHASHQQLDFTVNIQGLNVRFPETELSVKVMKNGLFQNVGEILPTYKNDRELQFTHNRNLIFDAGNEFRRFECLSVHQTTMGVDAISYVDPYYHAELLTDKVRMNYTFDEDHDGVYIVRNTESTDENDISSDYLFVNFTLKSEPLPGDVYVVGGFNGWNCSDGNLMRYDEVRRQYFLSLLLKQGYYEYVYSLVKADGLTDNSIEGDFYQTRNRYDVLVYYRPTGERADRLVGILKLESK
ncbi:MAG: DUF5103 domain-containing protein [Bacteroidaceae bacterium]|nr:DUF5103 domain-containing protein [Bacteroidaceae bacterium]